MLIRSTKLQTGVYGRTLINSIKTYNLANTLFSPLPEEMFFYARADTHFLLYIYDNMRNELIAKSNNTTPDENPIELVLQKSKETSLLRYERQIYDQNTGKGPGGWYQLLLKSTAYYNNEQFAVFKAVHQWRDEIARKDDDSTNYVMPNHMLFTLAKIMPVDMITLLGIIKGASHGVKSRADELLALIQSARERAPNGPNMMDILRPKASAATITHQGLTQQGDRDSSVNVVADGELRSDNSSFWGQAFGSSIWDAPQMTGKVADLRLAVPLPELSIDAFAIPEHALLDRLTGVESPPSSIRENDMPNTEAKKEDEAFVIKRGIKRKSEPIVAPEITGGETATGEYDISLNEEEEQALQERAAAKAQRKAEKKLLKTQRKLAREEAERSSKEVSDEEPFDYAKAQSVLHAKPNGNEAERSAKWKKPFDPYAKTMDAPKGMRKAQTERTGKSHTFRS